ncbi:MAG: hypothetical protein IPG01_18845 [Chitinophagaceae bacterium]|nr:hypothetical protein [Chitinophagaceae bacterium]
MEGSVQHGCNFFVGDICWYKYGLTGKAITSPVSGKMRIPEFRDANYAHLNSIP